MIVWWLILFLIFFSTTSYKKQNIFETTKDKIQYIEDETKNIELGLDLTLWFCLTLVLLTLYITY